MRRPALPRKSVTRAYIDRFIEQHHTDIKGTVLEVREPFYATRHPERVTRVEVIDIDGELPGVTIVADISDMPDVPADTFDTIILTQTLQYIFDLERAMGGLHRILAPGGVLLLTVPAAEPMLATSGFHHDLWRFTSGSVRQLLSGFASVETEAFGNRLAAISRYKHVPAGWLGKRLWVQDPLCPVVIGARAVKS